MNFIELSEIISNRRAVSPTMYLDRPISNETILKILENANWAPTHKKNRTLEIQNF